MSSRQPLVSRKEEVWELSKLPAGRARRGRGKGKLSLFVVAVSDPESSLAVYLRTVVALQTEVSELRALRRSISAEAQGRVEERKSSQSAADGWMVA